MNPCRNSGWGTWKFTKNAQEKLDYFSRHNECKSSNPKECKNLNNKLWRLIIDQVKTEVIPETGYDLGVDLENCSKLLGDKSAPETSVCEIRDEGYDVPTGISRCSVENDLDLASQEMVSDTSKFSPYADLENTLEDDDLMKISGDICDSLRKGPVKDISSMIKGKEVVQVLKAIKNNLSDEETLSNLLLSVCPPVEENLLEQSRWTPGVYQYIILPEILGRSSPVLRSLSSAISHLTSSSPDACVQLLCIPLLTPLNQQGQPSDLSQPVIEVLSKIIEESLPPQQKISLFRTFFKGMASRGKFTVKEDLFQLFISLAKTEGAFIGAESEFLSNLIDWLEVCSSDYASSIKFTKYLVAVLKGMAQDVSSGREGSSSYLSAEERVKLRNVVSQNRTFLKKIAEKTLKSIC